MKRIGLGVLMVCCHLVALAQSPSSGVVKFPQLDPSPLDVLYYPINAVKVKANEDASPKIKVLYSRPAKKGREIFGVLEQYGKVWRLGANESTEINFFQAVTIGDKKIKAGKYSLFAIPYKEKWTFILNKQTDRWGAFSYNEEKDILRIDLPVHLLEKPLEIFSMTFVDFEGGTNLVVAWDTQKVELPIYF